MSKITSELLQKLAPSTPKAKRDRFLPFLNEACPRYNITTELRVAAFLATICFESAYFRATKEGRATKAGKAKTAQDKYWGTGFYGRGLIQTTHEANYLAFSKAMFKKGLTEDAMLFVNNPELLEEPKWAVESACYFWESNKLNGYADKGKFFAIQGLTNRGNAAKEAWEYPTREKLYLAALRYMPDNFTLSSTEKAEDSMEESTTTTTEIVETMSDPKSEDDGVVTTKTETTESGSTPVPAKTSSPLEGWTTWATTIRAAWASLGITVTSIGSVLSGAVTNPLFIQIIIGAGILTAISGLIFAIVYLILRYKKNKDKEQNDLEINKLQLELAASKDRHNVHLVNTGDTNV